MEGPVEGDLKRVRFAPLPPPASLGIAHIYENVRIRTNSALISSRMTRGITELMLRKRSNSACELRASFYNEFRMELKERVTAQSTANLCQQETGKEEVINGFLKQNYYAGGCTFGSGNSFFKTFSYILNTPGAKRNHGLRGVTVWPENAVDLSPGARIRLRQKVIVDVLALDRNILRGRKLKRSDLLNPFALCSRQRVTDFLYSLVTYIQNQNPPVGPF